MTNPRPRNPPHPTPALDDQQLRDHVILDLDRLSPDEFMRRHATALRDLLISPIDSDADALDGLLGPYRKDITTLDDALGAAQETLTDVAKRLRQVADNITDMDSGEPEFATEVEMLLSMSDDLDKAYEAASDITLETEW